MRRGNVGVVALRRTVLRGRAQLRPHAFADATSRAAAVAGAVRANALPDRAAHAPALAGAHLSRARADLQREDLLPAWGEP